MLFVIQLLHISVIAFVLFGWLGWNNQLLLAHIFFVPAMILQWQFNDGTCILTNIENSLRKNNKPRQEQQGQFVKSLLKYIIDPLPSDKTIKIYLYGIITICWTISLLRFYFR